MMVAMVVLCLMMGSSCVQGLTFKVEAHKEECLYDQVEKVGVKVMVQYQVTAGGFLDIDLHVYAPGDVLIHSVERESEGKFTFVASHSGQFKFCFSNKMSTLTPKTVSFKIAVGDVLDPTLAQVEQLDPIERSIMRLNEGLSQIQQEQSYLRTRERVHRDTAESTNSRVLWWSLFEAFVLVAMSVWQVYYLRRFFEVKRAI